MKEYEGRWKEHLQKKKKRIRECKTSTSLQTERKKSYWPSKNRMEAETEIGKSPPPP